MSEQDPGLVSPPEARAAEFWTPERLAAVGPPPRATLTAEQFAATQTEFRSRAAEGGGLVVPPRIGGRVFSPVSTPVRETERVSDITRYPYSTVLKMLFSFNGAASLGTAFIVGKRAVLGSGSHAYYDGQWAQNVQFIPQYANGGAPFGTFSAVKMTTLREYVEQPNGQNLAYNLAAFVVDRDFPDELGVAGYAVNHLLQPGKLRSIGYPAQPRPGFDFDGQQMWESVGDYHDEGDPGFGTTGPRTWGHFNDLTGGSAGGPIFTDGVMPVVVGMNGHVLLSSPNGPPEEPPRMYSPYFGDHVLRLIRWLEQNGGMDEPPAPMPPLPLKAQLQAKLAELSALVARLPG